MNANDDHLAPGPPDNLVTNYSMESTLKELCLKAVILHRNRLILFRVEELKNLPITLKNKLLNMINCAWNHCCAEEIASEELCCFLATLMHNELTALTLPPLPTISTTTPQMDFLYTRLALFCNPLLIAVGKAPKSLEELRKALCGVPMLFDAIDTKCPSLKYLQIISTSSGFNHFPLVAGSSLGSSFCKVLPRLTILKLDCYKCDDWTLTQIASHATNLTLLQVALTSEVTSSGFAALTNLHHLEQFIFGEFMPERDEVLECKFLELCPQFLPQLKVAGRRFDFFEMDAIYNNGFKCIRGYHNFMLHNFHQPAVLGLKLLNLRQDYLPNENIQFPDLEELILWSPSSGAISLCDRFASVCALGLYGCGNFDVFPVLRHVGHRLHSLVLEDVLRLFTFGEVFRLCPDLKRFKVSASNVDEAPEQLSDAALWCMEDVFIDSVILPSGFLKQMFQSAAKLTKLKLNFCGLLNAELRELIQLVQQKPILQSLVSFQWIDDDDYHDPPGLNCKLANLLFKTLEDNCPNLVLFDLELR